MGASLAPRPLTCANRTFDQVVADYSSVPFPDVEQDQSIEGTESPVQPEGTRERLLRLPFEFHCVVAKHGAGEDQHHYGECADANADRSSEAADTFAEVVSGDAIGGSPEAAASRIEDEKALPRHAVRSREKRGKRPEHGDEAAEEDDGAAVAQKKILPDCRRGLRPLPPPR